MQKISEHVSVLGNGYFNYYLIGDEEAALVECGTRAGASIFARQWSQLNHKPEVRYIVALHSHFDHICGVTGLKQLFPSAQLVASALGQKLLSKERIVGGLYQNDQVLSEAYLENAFINEKPDYPASSVIPVDLVVGEGDVLKLGQDLNIKFLDAPGHSICSIAAYLENDQCLLVSDAMGYDLQDGTITPVFFSGYADYIATIQKFMTYPCQALGPAHGPVLMGEQVQPYLVKALDFAGQGFDYIKEQLEQGVEEKVLAQELFERYIKAGLSYYPKDMMLESMFLLIKSVKAVV
ncbi:MAG TPA: MBL fold metallo-hydrolase [Syntrophomonadaceae bacterium]|nr:MBL fold metallo-hydrolase [Syntrophomonadaceae bacterium]